MTASPRDRFVPAVAPEPEHTAASRESALCFAFSGTELLVHDAPGPAPYELATVGVLAATDTVPVRSQYLGALDGRAVYAAQLPEPFVPPPGFALVGLRGLYGRFDPALFDLAGTAYQIQYWDRTHQFCSACAAPLSADARERKKLCAACGAHYFPRVAPCAIVLVHDGPRVLLTRQSRFPPGMYGLVAGFLEAGETLETCAAREVREETGLEITDVRYFGSQPWPFPHQIMVGFIARYAGGELVVDHHELEEARWFDRDAMPRLPPRASIARRLIDTWLQGELP